MLLKKSGFTLAEVLITLGIIGIVAAVTIPSIINLIDDLQYQANFKKIFNEISQTIKLVSIDNGEYIDTSSASAIVNEFSKKLNFIKKGTWQNISTLPDGYYYNCYKATNTTNQCGGWKIKSGWQLNNPTMVLPSGAFITLRNASSNCNGNNYRVRLSITDPVPKQNLCSEIEIDVNGDNPPNMLGKDYFLIVLIKENGQYLLYPSGIGSMACIPGTPNDYNASLGCAAIALKGGNMP